ncbi:MAG: hydrolase [Janthinobacterium lividum]
MPAPLNPIDRLLAATGRRASHGTDRHTSNPQPFQPVGWLPGPHAQTIFPALFAKKADVAYRRERWTAPDGDFIDLDWVDAATANAPLLVLFHGLEGNSDSHYARNVMHAATLRGWRAVVPHFRSCSGELNLGPRFYHSGDSAEIDWILRRLQATCSPPALFAAGVSLGGNALLRWLGERQEDAQIVTAAAAVSAPVDLAAGGHALSFGFNRLYTRHFLKTLKIKSAAKLRQHPGLFDRQAMLAAADLHAFDDVVTAPLHGYRDADDYWQRASAKPLLLQITVPTLVLNARNDPFLPAAALPNASHVSSQVLLEQPAHGGHVGFMTGSLARPFGRSAWLAERLMQFFQDVEG